MLLEKADVVTLPGLVATWKKVFFSMSLGG